MTAETIFLSMPFLGGRELAYVAEAAAAGHLAGDGKVTARCEALLQREMGVPRVMLTSSGTHALEMAALLLNIGAGDEVVVPSYTFVSTANAFVLRGARPVFADIRPDTLGMDAASLESLITPRTKAVSGCISPIPAKSRPVGRLVA